MALRFYRSDGDAIPRAADVTAFLAANAEAGLDIGPHTGECLWDGVQMDLAMVMDGLLQADGRL